MNKVQIISDKNQKSLKIKSVIQKKINQNEIKRSNITIVIGGDGFMLQTLKKNRKSKKFFYGVNSGSYGFLMNKFSSKNIVEDKKSGEYRLSHHIDLKTGTYKGRQVLDPKE